MMEKSFFLVVIIALLGSSTKTTALRAAPRRTEEDNLLQQQQRRRLRILQSSDGTGLTIDVSLFDDIEDQDEGSVTESSPEEDSSPSIQDASSTEDNILDFVNIESMTGGPFIGPEVFVDDSATRDKDNNSNIKSSNLDVTKRIVGGYDAEPHPFHSMLLLRYGGGWRWAGCGGTLITNCHVLTAAHCAADPSKPLGAVMVNAHTPYQENGDVPFHFSQVEQVIRHGGFNETTNANDIAVIKMAECLNTTEFPPAVPVNTSMVVPDDLMADILGFGKLSEEGSLFLNVETLQVAEVPVISADQCTEYYGDRIKSDMICGGFANGGSDACQGDSGSSMTYVQPDGSTAILGVISWGVGCGRSHSPGVYSSVQYHFNWLARQICSDPDTNISWCDGYSSSPTSSPSASSSSPPAETTSETTMSPSTQKLGAYKERTAEGSYTTMLLEKTRMDTSSASSVANVETLVGQDRSSSGSSSSLTFWDASTGNGCKTAGDRCWLGNECCSGICRQLPNESAMACSSPASLVVGATKRKRTRGVRMNKDAGV